MTIKVNDSGTLKEPTQIFVKGDLGTLYGVNYVVVNNNGTLSTAWSAIYNTSRGTTTSFNTTTTFDTNTAFNTTTSYTTTYNTNSTTSQDTSKRYTTSEAAETSSATTTG